MPKKLSDNLLNIDLFYIHKLGLNLNEYFTLLKIKNKAEGIEFPFIEDERFFDNLINNDFIQLIEGTPTLSTNGINLFNSDDDLFIEFYTLFPIKVPSETGFRPVSTGSPDGINGKATHSLWIRLTKNKPTLQRRIIDNLKKELEYRKSSNTLGYLQNIDTWLRQATWEKWDMTPEEQNKNNNYIKL